MIEQGRRQTLGTGGITNFLMWRIYILLATAANWGRVGLLSVVPPPAFRVATTLCLSTRIYYNYSLYCIRRPVYKKWSARLVRCRSLLKPEPQTKRQKFIKYEYEISPEAATWRLLSPTRSWRASAESAG